MAPASRLLVVSGKRENTFRRCEWIRESEVSKDVLSKSGQADRARGFHPIANEGSHRQLRLLNALDSHQQALCISIHIYLEVIFPGEVNKAQTLTLLRGLSGAAPASLSIEPGLARFCRASGVARTISSQVGDSGTVGAGARPSFCVKSKPLGEEKVV